MATDFDNRSPNSVENSNQGVENSKLKQFDKAITDFTRAIELDPKSALAYSNRGIAYANLQQYDKAIGD